MTSGSPRVSINLLSCSGGAQQPPTVSVHETQPSEPVHATLFGKRIFADVIRAGLWR